MSLYALHSLSNLNQKFIHSFIGTNRARSDEFSFAIASCLAGAVQLQKEIDEMYFARVYQVSLIDKLNQLNELLRLDLDKIMGYATKLYNHRQAQFCSTGWTNVIHGEETAVADFFGLTRYFSTEDLLLIKREGPQLSADILAIQSLFTAIGFFNE